MRVCAHVCFGLLERLVQVGALWAAGLELSDMRIRFDPHPQPQNSSLRISACNKFTNGNSY